ncbi:MAG: hypothetical protein N2450_01885 [bacterium]|nr:hypothetical protein [bacterium]
MKLVLVISLICNLLWFWSCTKVQERPIRWYISTQFPLSLEDSTRIASHLDNELGAKISIQRFSEVQTALLFQSDSAHLILLPTVQFLQYDFDTIQYVPFLIPISLPTQHDEDNFYQFAILGHSNHSIPLFQRFAGKLFNVMIPKDTILFFFQKTIRNLDGIRNLPIQYQYSKACNYSEINNENDSVFYLCQYSSKLDTTLLNKVQWVSQKFPKWITIIQKNLSFKERQKIATAIFNLPSKHTSPYFVERFVSCSEMDLLPLRQLMKSDTTFFYPYMR